MGPPCGGYYQHTQERLPPSNIKVRFSNGLSDNLLDIANGMSFGRSIGNDNSSTGGVS